MTADPFKTDDAAKPEELAVCKFATAAFAALESQERVELPGAVLVRLPGGFRIERKKDAA